MTRCDEGLHDVEIDVGVEQRLADLLEALLDVRFGDAAAAAQLLQRVAQTSLKTFEHAVVPLNK